MHDQLEQTLQGDCTTPDSERQILDSYKNKPHEQRVEILKKAEVLTRSGRLHPHYHPELQETTSQRWSIKAKHVFALHFVVVTLSHIAVPAIGVALVAILATTELNAWLKVFGICVVWFFLIWGANHVASEDSSCCLTIWETKCRQREGEVEDAGAFIPRYYALIKRKTRSATAWFRRKS